MKGKRTKGIYLKGEKIECWANLKRNYMLVLPHTFGLIIGFGFLYIFGVSILNHIKTITDPNSALIALIVFMFVFLKLLSWIGPNLINKWADKLHDALAY